jgi:hypothetical protein
LVALASYGTYNIDDKSFYLVPICIVYAILIIVIWIDFKPINRIKIYLVSKKIQVISRNLFQRLFIKFILKKENQYEFNEVTSFVVRSNKSSKADFKKYFVDIKLKDRDAAVLISFAKEEQAYSFATFLTDLIKN